MYAHAKLGLFYLLTDETDSGNALRLSPPRTGQHQELLIQIPLGEDGYLDLENNKGKSGE